MTFWEFLSAYGPGLGGVSFVAGAGLLVWWADARRDRRRAVALAAEPLMTLREALLRVGSDPDMRRVVRDAWVMENASDEVWAQQQALFLTEPHPPG